MSVCTACQQLRGRSSKHAPHSALLPLIGHSRVPFVGNSDMGGNVPYLCRRCNSILVRDAFDGNADPVWELYAG